MYVPKIFIQSWCFSANILNIIICTCFRSLRWLIQYIVPSDDLYSVMSPHKKHVIFSYKMHLYFILYNLYKFVFCRLVLIWVSLLMWWIQSDESIQLQVMNIKIKKMYVCGSHSIIQFKEVCWVCVITWISNGLCCECSKLNLKYIFPFRSNHIT